MNNKRLDQNRSFGVPAVCYPCQGAPSSTPRLASHEAFSHCDLGTLKCSQQPKPTTSLVSSRGEFRRALFNGTLDLFSRTNGKGGGKGILSTTWLIFSKTSLSPKFKASFPESHKKHCSVLAQHPDPPDHGQDASPYQAGQVWG